MSDEPVIERLVQVAVPFTVEFSADEVAAISHALGHPADTEELRAFAEDALNGALDEAKFAMERALGEADEVDETIEVPGDA